MGSFDDALSGTLSRLAELLGLKPSDARRLGLMEEKLSSSKAANIDRLEGLKDKIRKLEQQAVLKKREYESVKGEGRRIVVSEIERVFRDIDRLQGQCSIINANIDRISIAQAKLQELKDTNVGGIEEDQLDDISLELKDAFEGLQTSDRAVRDLEGVQYDAPGMSKVDVEGRMAEITGEQETRGGLSAETEKRLKQLEEEED